MGSGGSSRIGKRGMSPLIATVLLMAFAVALGGMIMNWSIDRKTSGDCEMVKLQVTKFCNSQGNIHLAVRNDKESVALRELKVSFVQSSIESTMRIVDSQLAPGQPLEEVSIPVAIQQGTPVDLIGVIGPETDPLTCEEPIRHVASLPDC